MVLLLFANLFLFFVWGSSLYSWREAVAKSCLWFACYTFVFTESLSYFNQLTLYGLTACWAVVLVVSLVYLVRRKVSFPSLRHFALFFTEIPSYLGWSVVGMLALLLVQAIGSPPNNYDSMSYHMARVSHWIQNQNVSYYPTSIARQLYHNPMAEYLILQFQLLTGDDWFANLIQFGAMVGSLALVLLLAQSLSLSKWGQFFAVLLAFSLPTGLFQSTSTQNDYVATFFLLSIIYEGSKLTTQWSWSGIVQLGLALALGALTKYTVLVFALPFCLWFGIRYFLRYGLAKCLVLVSILVLCLGIVLSPLVARNLQTFQNPVGPQAGSSLNLPMANTPINALNTYSNVLRNTGNQVGLPWVKYNQWIDQIIVKFHQIVHLELNERNNSYLNDQYHTSFSFDEDLVSNPLHLLLFGVTIVGLSLRFASSASTHKKALLYAFCLIIGFVLFSALLRWQSTSGRLLLPLFVVSSLPTAYFLEKGLLTKRQQLLAFGLLLLCLPVLLFNKSKPVIVLDDWVRHWLKQPQQMIPDYKFNEFLKAHPEHAPLLQGTYEQPYLTHYFQLKKEVSLAQKQELLQVFDASHFMEKKAFWASSRQDNYFRNRRSLGELFGQLSQELNRNQCKNVGFDLGFDGMEYPLWVLLQSKGVRQIEYVRFAPVLASTPNVPREFTYDCLITEFDDSMKDYPQDQIKFIYDYGEIKLIVFKNPQRKLIVRDRFFFDPSYL
ncbi:MAG: glycosyltransferase family 39 protein [Spirosomataceae bacterium]